MHQFFYVNKLTTNGFTHFAMDILIINQNLGVLSIFVEEYIKKDLHNLLDYSTEINQVGKRGEI